MVVTREITPEFRKEANRLFWMAKGHLIPDRYSDEDIRDVYDQFLKRFWYNNEAYIREEGFDQEYGRRNAEES